MITIANRGKRRHRKGRKRHNPAVVRPALPVVVRARPATRNPSPLYGVAEVINPKKHHRKHYRRNPVGASLGSIKTQVFEGLKVALPVLAGIYVTRYATRAILKEKDTGTTGYLANGATAIALGLAARFAGWRKASMFLVTGGIVATLARIGTDKIPALQGTLSGVGTPPYYVLQGAGDFIQPPNPLLGFPELDLRSTRGMMDFLQPGGAYR